MSNKPKTNETKKNFTVNTQGYVFLGWTSGMLEATDGRKVPYYNMFGFSPGSAYKSEDYKASGFKSEPGFTGTVSISADLQIPSKREKLLFLFPHFVL